MNIGEELNENAEKGSSEVAFLGISQLASKYNIIESVENDIITCQKNEISAIFAKYNTITQAGQRELLEVLRNICPETQRSLPVQGRTLRPKNIPHVLIQLDPGELAYFGIASVLSLTRFYDTEENTIRLSINTDGSPAFTSSNYNFWPILGAVDKYPEFMIAIYGGPQKPKCSNEFLDLFVGEVIELQKKGIKLSGKTFRFELHNALMDVPATSYRLGTKS